MSNLHEAINKTLILHAIESVVDGNLKDLHDTGFSAENIKALESLNLSDLPSIVADESFLNFKINNKLLSTAIMVVKNKKEELKLIELLIKADAPLNYVKQHFSINREAFISTRLKLEMGNMPRGATKEPDQDEIDLINKSCKYHNTEDYKSPEILLKIHNDTGLSIRKILKEVNKTR